jgi:hypothetical protein
MENSYKIKITIIDKIKVSLSYQAIQKSMSAVFYVYVFLVKPNLCMETHCIGPGDPIHLKQARL